MRPSEKDLAVASVTSLAYVVAILLSTATDNAFYFAVATAVFCIWLYACRAIDREEKRRLRRRERDNERLAEALAELDEWRQAREAD